MQYLVSEIADGHQVFAAAAERWPTDGALPFPACLSHSSSSSQRAICRLLRAPPYVTTSGRHIRGSNDRHPGRRFEVDRADHGCNSTTVAQLAINPSSGVTLTSGDTWFPEGPDDPNVVLIKFWSDAGSGDELDLRQISGADRPMFRNRHQCRQQAVTHPASRYSQPASQGAAPFRERPAR